MLNAQNSQDSATENQHETSYIDKNTLATDQKKKNIRKDNDYAASLSVRSADNVAQRR